MPNVTIHKYPRRIINNPDGTTTTIEKSLRQNGDVSTVIKVKGLNGHTLVVYHMVFDASGELVHAPHEEPGSRDPAYTVPFNEAWTII